MKKLVFVCLVLFAMAVPVTVWANYEVNKIHDTGRDYNRLVFVIMGDGYTAGEQQKFNKDAKELADYILNAEPYNRFKEVINIYTLNVESNVSGAADDPETPIDNYFGSTYNYYQIRRLLVPLKSEKVYALLDDAAIDFDIPVIIVNSNEYGGSGGDIAVTSTNSAAHEIIVHEVAHTFAGLKDEYFAGSIYMGEALNQTKNSDPATVGWSNLIGKDPGIGVFHLAEGYYRPSQNCKMEKLDVPFCYVCNHYLSKRIVAETLKDDPVKAQTGQLSAEKTDNRVVLNGELIEFPAYLINGSNYLKLRDVAAALSKTTKTFNVTYDESANMIRAKSFIQYQPVGKELLGLSDPKSVSSSISGFSVDGMNITLSGYLINDNNYFKLRDIAKIFDVYVDFDQANNLVILNTDAGYSY